MQRIKQFIYGIDPAITEAISFITACSILMFLLLGAMPAQGAVKQYNTPILGITTSANGFNGCMIKVRPVDPNLFCEEPTNNATFLSLDCTGEWVDPSDAQNNLRTAQIAMLTGKNVNVVVNDRFTTDRGYCLAQQLTIFK